MRVASMTGTARNLLSGDALLKLHVAPQETIRLDADHDNYVAVHDVGDVYLGHVSRASLTRHAVEGLVV